MLFLAETGLVLGALISLILTIIIYIAVMPRRKDGAMGGFGQFLHNFFHFKKLYIEEILKFFYVLATIGCICMGALLIFSYEEFGWRYITRESTFVPGLIIMIAGPIGLRLVYEVLMMGILLVKNVIDINNKLPQKEKYTAPVQPAAPVAPVQPAPAAPVAPAAPAQPAAPQAAPQAAPAPTSAPKAPPAPFCTICGSRNNPDGTCPNHCTK